MLQKQNASVACGPAHLDDGWLLVRYTLLLFHLLPNLLLSLRGRLALIAVFLLLLRLAEAPARSGQGRGRQVGEPAGLAQGWMRI